MKALILSICILSFAGNNSAIAQEWFPIGAKWRYSYTNGWPPSFIREMIVKSDTIISGVECKRLDIFDVGKNFTPENIDVWVRGLVSSEYLYFNNDTVFQYVENEFHPLYMFNLNQGDTVLVNEERACCDIDNIYYTKVCCYLEYVVDSIDYININNHDLKRIYNSHTNDPVSFGNVTFNRNWSGNNYPIIEYIGSTEYFFGLINGFHIMEGDIRRLECYEDENIQYYAEGFVGECEFTLPENPSNTSNFNKSLLKIYPNPFDELIIIEDKSNVSISYDIITIEGKHLINGTGNTINTAELKSGIYILRIISDKEIIKYQKIIKR